MLTFVLVVAGMLLIGWGVWARLGRTERARAWTGNSQPRHALFGRVGGGLALVGAGLIAADGPLAIGLPGLLLFAVGLLVLFAFDVLGVPYPASWAPAWARGPLAAGRRARPLGAGRARRWPGPVPPPSAPDVPQPWQPLRDRIAAALPALPEGATLVISDDGTESHLYVRYQQLGDVLSVDVSGSQEWGGPWPVAPAQDQRMHDLGWQRPAERTGAYDRTNDYRLDVSIDSGVDDATASSVAAHGVVALATLGGAAEHGWHWEQYA